nr:hypothetical protein A4A49_24889 [Ipomoea batatas]
MSYISRVCMATSVVVVENKIDHFSRYFSGVRTPQPPPVAPRFSGEQLYGRFCVNGDRGRGENGKRKEVDKNDESLLKVMLINWWALN